MSLVISISILFCNCLMEVYVAMVSLELAGSSLFFFQAKKQHLLPNAFSVILSMQNIESLSLLTNNRLCTRTLRNCTHFPLSTIESLILQCRPLHIENCLC
jgi:hypothetical protein